MWHHLHGSPHTSKWPVWPAKPDSAIAHFTCDLRLPSKLLTVYSFCNAYKLCACMIRIYCSLCFIGLRLSMPCRLHSWMIAMVTSWKFLLSRMPQVALFIFTLLCLVCCTDTCTDGYLSSACRSGGSQGSASVGVFLRRLPQRWDWDWTKPHLRSYPCSMCTLTVAAETDFLFCQDTGMGRHRAKRKRKEEPLRAGEFPWITGNHHLSQSSSPALHLLLLWAYAAGNIGYT